MSEITECAWCRKDFEEGLHHVINTTLKLPSSLSIHQFLCHHCAIDLALTQGLSCNQITGWMACVPLQEARLRRAAGVTS